MRSLTEYDASNHTLQLSAKALLRPLNPGIIGGTSPTSDNEDEADDADECPPLIIDDESDDDNGDGSANDDGNELDDPDDEIDELSQLDSVVQQETIRKTIVVREAVSKVRSLLCCCSQILTYEVHRYDFCPLR